MALFLLLAQSSPDPSEAVKKLSGMAAIYEVDGFAMAITGMAIVFVALTAISLFIGFLPRGLAALGPWLPEIESHHDQPAARRPAPSALPASGVDRRMVAAIAWAVNRRR